MFLVKTYGGVNSYLKIHEARKFPDATICDTVDLLLPFFRGIEGDQQEDGSIKDFKHN
jgi:hypothetical protein